MVNKNLGSKIVPILLTTLLMLVVFAISAFIAIQSGRIRQKTSLSQPTLTPTLTQVNESTDSDKDVGVRCKKDGGVWLAAYNECEGVNQETCEKYGGEFDSCASACRHKPETEVCIQICVEVCSFSKREPGEPTL